MCLCVCVLLLCTCNAHANDNPPLASLVFLRLVAMITGCLVTSWPSVSRAGPDVSRGKKSAPHLSSTTVTGSLFNTFSGSSLMTLCNFYPDSTLSLLIAWYAYPVMHEHNTPLHHIHLYYIFTFQTSYFRYTYKKGRDIVFGMAAMPFLALP